MYTEHLYTHPRIKYMDTWIQILYNFGKNYNLYTKWTTFHRIQMPFYPHRGIFSTLQTSSTYSYIM